MIDERNTEHDKVKKINIANRLTENSRENFADLQSQKDSKRNRPKKKLWIYSVSQA